MRARGYLEELNIPLLDLVESLEERDGHKDHDGLLAMTNFELSTTKNNPTLATRTVLPAMKGRLGALSQGDKNYLLGGRDLERAERRLKIGNLRLEVVKSLSNAGLQLRRVGERGGVVGDLVAGHFEGR